MKKIFIRYASMWGFALAIAGALTLSACQEDNPEGVDLRFEESGKLVVEDMYVRTAKDNTPIKIRVRSDKDWKLVGNADWYTITPSEGPANFDLKDANGNPTGTEVTIVCKENVELDNREDLISIVSGQWTGKQFTLLQKGIAYLNADVESLQQSKEVGTATFNLSTNQPFTVEVTEGSNWLKVTENAKGGSPKKDEVVSVKLAFEANLGEERVGKVTLFDRNHNTETKVDVICTQAGIVLIPAVPDNGYYKFENHLGGILEIPVESNGQWSVSKEKADDNWYSFVGQTTFEGNGTVKVQLAENEGTAVRVLNLPIQTPEVAGAEVVRKVVVIKQANLPKPEVYPINAGGVGTWDGASDITLGDDKTLFNSGDIISKAGFKPGKFKLTVSGMSATSHPYLYLEYKSAAEGTQHEIRIAFNDAGRPYWTFLTPWVFTAPNVNTWCLNNIGALNGAKTNEMEIHLSRFATTDPVNAKEPDAIKVEWFFNGVRCHTAMTDGVTRGALDTPSGQSSGNAAYAQPYKSTMRVKLGCTSASCYLEKFEYTPNVDWGD